MATFEIEPKSSSLFLGSSLTLRGIYSESKSPIITWTSSDNTIATVSSLGVVNAFKEGTVTITGTCEDLTSKSIIQFVKSTSNSIGLEKDILTVFENQKTESDFTNGITKAIKDYIEGATVITTDGGTLINGTGVFVGVGKGSVSLTDSLMKNPLLSACNIMYQTAVAYRDGLVTEPKDESFFVNAFANGLRDMLSELQIVNCRNVSGTLTSPSGVTTPFMGDTKGDMDCSLGISTFQLGLLEKTLQMRLALGEQQTKGDDWYANQISTLLKTFLSTIVISTKGIGSLQGSLGVGLIG